MAVLTLHLGNVLIQPRERKLGGVRIRRLLPARERQRVGPFIFMDHIGPVAFPAKQGIDVPPHPHIDLATVTYLFEGSLVHRDSLGFTETIRPGEINWMHAGRGIVHSERTGPAARRTSSVLHGIQLWAALPRRFEGSDPRFDHYAAAALPVWNEPGLCARVLVGEAFGLRSPVHTASKTLYVDLTLEAGGRCRVPEAGETGLYVVEGQVSAGGRECVAGELLTGSGALGAIVAAVPARVLVLGGEPLEGARHISWNFVSSSRARIDEARRDWRAGRFPQIPGDDRERAPMPESPAD